MGIFWSLWHVPAFFEPNMPHWTMPMMVVLAFIVFFGVFMGFVFNRAGDSVLATMAAHLSLKHHDRRRRCAFFAGVLGSPRRGIRYGGGRDHHSVTNTAGRSSRCSCAGDHRHVTGAISRLKRTRALNKQGGTRCWPGPRRNGHVTIANDLLAAGAGRNVSV